MIKYIEIKAVDTIENLQPYIDMKIFEIKNINETMNIIRVPGGIVLNQNIETKTGNVPGITRMFQLDLNSIFIPFPQWAIEGDL